MIDGVICIIGMHRSGTSMVARLLQDAGLYLGPADRLLGADGANPEGHFEHTGFLAINDGLLSHLGGAWDLPPALSPDWQSAAELTELRAAAESVVGTFPSDRPWGWKEPRTTLLLPFWKSIIRQPRFVICVRSPLDVAKSLTSRNRMALDHGVSLWSQYMAAAIRETAGYPRQLVFYDDFFRSDDVAIGRFLEFCGLPSSGSAGASLAAVRSALRHHHSEGTELLGSPAVSAHAKLLYLGLRALSQNSLAAPQDDPSNAAIGRLLALVDEFHDDSQVGQLRAALTDNAQELSRLRHEFQIKLATIGALENQLVELQQHADRLQTFSDAVRGAWPYRFYRKFVRSWLSQ